MAVGNRRISCKAVIFIHVCDVHNWFILVYMWYYLIVLKFHHIKVGCQHLDSWHSAVQMMTGSSVLVTGGQASTMCLTCL